MNGTGIMNGIRRTEDEYVLRFFFFFVVFGECYLISNQMAEYIYIYICVSAEFHMQDLPYFFHFTLSIYNTGVYCRSKCGWTKLEEGSARPVYIFFPSSVQCFFLGFVENLVSLPFMLMPYVSPSIFACMSRIPFPLVRSCL